MTDVLVLHTALGLTDGALRWAHRLRTAGDGSPRRVVAPDLFDGTTFTGPDAYGPAMEHVGRVDPHTMRDRAREALEQLDGPAVLVGVSLGTVVAVDLARAVPDRAAGLVLLAGGGGRPLTGDAVPPVMALHAMDDEFVDAAVLATLLEGHSRGGAATEHHVLPALPHLFMDETRPEEFRPAWADETWRRVESFVAGLGSVR